MKLQSYCGEIYIENKEYKKAIEVYSNSLTYYPDKYEIYYKLGICYSMINDFNIAKECFQKTVELNKDQYLAYYRLGQIALLYRDFDVAEENFKKSIYKEKEAKAYFELAKIYMLKNEKDKAIININKSIESDSKFYEIAQNEPMFFSIKNLIIRDENENKKEYEESQEEKEIEEYLNGTYNLTKSLNSKREENKRNNET